MAHRTVAGLAILLALSASLAAAKPAEDNSGLKPGQCFRWQDVQNSVQVNETQLNLVTNDHRYIRIDTNGTCFSGIGTDFYVVRSRGGLDEICSPIDLDLSAGPPGFKTPCLVNRISQMSPAEVSALPRKAKP